MKILVAVKRVIDYNVQIRVKEDGSGVVTDNVKMSTNPPDDNAIEEAVKIKEAGKAKEIVAITIGEEKAQETVRKALAVGADRGIHVKVDSVIEPLAVSKILEAHSGLTGLIAEKTNYDNNQFDGMWISSLTVSTTKGKPDTEIIDFSSRFQTIEEILEVTTKPIVVDGDTGGKIEHFKFTVRTLERLGISAVIIEDKIGNKRNSLFGNSVKQEQDTIQHFCKKIEVGKNALITDDFMIIARIESLIMKKGYQDAIDRAKAYIDAGADGIMIHSKDSKTKELQSFCDIYNKFQNRKPLILVPTAYSQYTELELNKKFGANLIIYANQLLRSAYPSMAKVAESILKHSRSEEASKKYCMSIKDIITLIPEDY